MKTLSEFIELMEYMLENSSSSKMKLPNDEIISTDVGYVADWWRQLKEKYLDEVVKCEQ